MTPKLDSLILGVNPLVGVDHYSRARGRDKIVTLRSENILQTIDSAFSAGARGFNFGVDPRIYGILQEMQTSQYDKSFGMYLILPDMRTYSSAFLTNGTMGVMRALLSNLDWYGKAKAITRGGLAALTQDPIRAMNLYVDIEVNKLEEVAPQVAQLRSVLIFEAITDLILSFRAKDLAREYIAHVTDAHHVKPGFITRNFTRFVDFCIDSKIALDSIIIMTPFNSLGFQMSPSRESCEETLAKSKSANVIAMSLMAGGAISFEAAEDYLDVTKDIRSVVVGTSDSSHARETFGALKPILDSRL